MQLRAARLCLDCEELHVDDTCPICASGRYVFLSTWLPVEERRRWRRGGPPSQTTGTPRTLPALWRQVRTWLGVAEPTTPPRPRTRASDHVPNLDFDGQKKEHPREQRSLDPHPAQASRDSRS
jgi:hypothetical protein